MEENKISHEIDLLKLAGKVIKEWKTLLLFILCSMTIGIIVALSTPKEYSANVLLAPELSSGGLGLSSNLEDMASSFGFDISGKSSMDAIYPELYPDIFQSTDFLLGLFSTPVRLKDNPTIRSYKDHIQNETKFPFWYYPKLWVANLLKKKTSTSEQAGQKDRFKISKIDYDLCNAISKKILCNIDKKTSVISISVSDQDPLVAAIMADTLQNRLQTYITNYRTQKARADMNYYKALTVKAKQDYEKARRTYGGYADANTDIILESFKAKQEDLVNDMQLKYNAYTSLNTQLQAAKAKVQERTPAFTILQKPIMPYIASSMPRSLMVILFMLVGLFLDVLWILYGKNYLKKKKS
ncbi:Wzz/FepE/Etk N-terminal domain-containing protein [Hallella colorans]|uniref:Wzz/FepE/Etk N-terminal domain-containing protein n=1 Tax=Hallella colorans TaxID=1703337 RepID=UPI0023F30322|nr:Wzz/FepE/Etk N-terminal domain-containing protein [Hallella colorans]